MGMPQVSWALVIAGAALGAALVLLTLALGRAWRRQRWRRRLRRGRWGEEQAPALLEKLGFEVLAAEERLEGVVEVDGEARSFEVRVDFMVRRRRRIYAVEVKTGERAPDPLQRSTRRQLREYAALLGVDGLFLLDMEARELHDVRFPELAARVGSRRGLLWAVLLAVTAGLLLGFAAGLLLAPLWGRVLS